MKRQFIFGAAFAALALTVAAPAFAHGTGEKVTKTFDQAIPNIAGKSLVTFIVEYAPGGVSAPHVHSQTAFIYAYVISGEIESKVNDGPKRVYKAGESWSEPPGALHAVSGNASKTKPAKLLAVFVADTGDSDLTKPAK